MNPTDDEVLAAVAAAPAGFVGTRELAEVLGIPVRKLDTQLNRLERAGRIHVERPGGGVTGERRIRLDGDTVESLRGQLAKAQTAAMAGHEAWKILNTAFGGSR